MTDAENRLRDGLRVLGFEEPSITKALLDFAALVLEANERTNLVGPSSIDELVGPHLLDSLAPLAGRRLAGNLIDVGSGAGFPAIPIAIAFPALHVVMLEPRAKRIEFLEMAIGQLQLANCQARKLTAETAGRSDLRETAANVTVRAVARPSTALELAVPLARRGGRVLLYVGRQCAPNEHELEVAKVLGADLLEAKEVEVPYLQGVRHAWWFEKKKHSPSEYPRRAKVPSKQPL